MKKKLLIPHHKIRNALRKLWLWSDQRKEAKARAKLGRGLGWLCEICRTPSQHVEIDHVVACGATPGSKNAGPDTSWSVFIERMFCDPSGLRVLCRSCHKRATQMPEIKIHDEAS